MIECIIVGLGKIGLLYDFQSSLSSMTHCRAIMEHKGFNLQAAVDLNVENRVTFGRMYDRPTYNSISSAATHHNPSLVVVSTPSHTHLDVLTEVFKTMSPRIIVCEKPMGYTIDQAAKIVTLCKQHDSEIFVNFMRVSDPAVMAIKQRINSLKTAFPWHGQVFFTGTPLNNGSHFVNLLQFLFGEIKHVVQSNEGLDIGLKDFKLIFSSGSCMFTNLNQFERPYFSYEILSSSYRIYCGPEEAFILFQNLNDQKAENILKRSSSEPETIPLVHDRYQFAFYDAIHKKINGNTSAFVCDGAGALETWAVIESIYSESIK